VNFSTDGGASYTQVGGTIGAAGDVPQSLSVAPNFKTNGNIAVGLNPVGATNAVFTQTRASEAWAAAWTGIGPALAAADNGAWAEFSPRYVSDGTIMAIYSVLSDEAAFAGLDADAAADIAILEARSVAGADFAADSSIGDEGSQVVSAGIAFPSDYNTAGQDTYFCTIDDGAGDDGTAYRRQIGAWTARNPTGTNIDMRSIAVAGDYESAAVFVGVDDTPTIYKTTDGMDNWVTPTDPADLGGSLTAAHTQVVVSPSYASDNAVYAVTEGTNGGYWRTNTGGPTDESWWGVGLYVDNYDSITGIAISPNFATDNTMFTVQNAGGTAHAVFKSTDAKTGSPHGADADFDKVSTLDNVRSVAVSPTFATDGVVYIAGTTTQIARSTNSGQWFSEAFINAIPSGTIVTENALAAADSNTVFVIATEGRLHRSDDAGATWITWNSGLQAVDTVEISPNFANDSTVLVGGRTSPGGTAVYISTDAGVTYSPVGTGPGTSAVSRVSVCFSSEYATDSTIYVAEDRSTGDVYRWVVGESTSWQDLDCEGFDSGSTPDAPTRGRVKNLASGGNGLIYVTLDNAAADGVHRALYPTADYDGSEFTWLELGWAPAADPETCMAGSGKLDQGLAAENANATLDMKRGMVVAYGSGNTIIVVDTEPAVDDLYIYTDNLNEQVVLVSPPDGEVRTDHPDTAQWESYSGVPGVNYQVQVSRDDPTFTDRVYTNLSAALTGLNTDLGAFASEFESGHTFYWRVRAQNAAAVGITDVASPWSDARGYSAGVGTPSLNYPASAPGLPQTVDTMAFGFDWQAVEWATDYRLQVATNPTREPVPPTQGAIGPFTNPVLDLTVGSSSTSWLLAGDELEPNTTYYWQVQPLFGDQEGRWWNRSAQAGATGVFKTPPSVVTPPQTVEAALAAISTELVRVYGWDASDAADPWKLYDPAVPETVNDLTDLESGQGYWVNVSAACTLNGVPLSPGWNLYGHR
jgi:hypothetical protein